MNRDEYYSQFNWNKSPFIKSTSLDIPIIERTGEYQQLCESIGGWDRIMLITAPIGYGKTTFMNLLIKKKPQNIDYLVYFDAYEPVEEVMARITHTLPLWKRLGKGSVDRTSFAKFLNGKLGKKKILLMFDESQDFEDELFRWLRILNDRVDNVFIIFLGLHGLVDRISAETALRDRKTKEMTLSPFSIDQLRQIVLIRLKWAGGNGKIPFEDDGLTRLCESANGIPRKLLENGQRVLEYSSKENVTSIDATIVENVVGAVYEDVKDVQIVEKHVTTPDFEMEKVTYVNFLDHLSPTQQDIIRILQTHERISISEMCESLDKDIRSLGSLIRKLRGLNKSEVARKPDVPYPVVVRVGKEKRGGRQQYVYSLSDNARRMLTST